MSTVISGKDSSTGKSESVNVTSNGLHVVRVDIPIGSDEAAGVVRTETNNGAVSKARSTSNVIIGTTGAAGDYLSGVTVTVLPTTAALEIKNGAGTVVISIPITGVTIGQSFEIPGGGCTTTGGGFYIASHASGVGTVTCFGRFT